MTQDERKQLSGTINSLLCWDAMRREYLLTTPKETWDQRKYDIRAQACDEALTKLRSLGLDII